MKISIIILNYKSEKLVRYCVENIKKANVTVSHEIIVVNNDTTEALIPVQRFLEGVVVVQANGNHGFSAGNNLGIQRARGEYVLIINPDIVVLPTSIETLVSFLDNHPRAALVGPRLINPDKSLQYSVFRFPRLYRDFFIPVYARTQLGRAPAGEAVLGRYLMKDWKHDELRRVDWILGASILARKSFLQACGGFDERFFLYNEDMDLCMRAWISGCEVWYHAGSVMIHYVERILPEQRWYQSVFDKYTWIHSISWLKFFWKWRKEIFNNHFSLTDFS